MEKIKLTITKEFFIPRDHPVGEFDFKKDHNYNCSEADSSCEMKCEACVFGSKEFYKAYLLTTAK